jgi:hypothetical protein
VPFCSDRERELNRLYQQRLTPETGRRIQQLLQEEIAEHGLTVRALNDDGTWTDMSIPPKEAR